MSPIPEQLVNRWRDGRGTVLPGEGTLYWHVLLRGNRQLNEAARTAQERMAQFPGLHMTPLEWLHLTVLIAGPANQISDQAMQEMLAFGAGGLLARILGMTVPNKLANAKKLSNGWGNVRFTSGGGQVVRWPYRVSDCSDQ